MKTIARGLALAGIAVLSAAENAPTAPPDVSVAARQVDAVVEKCWREHKRIPSPDVSDAEFLRRVSLDICGIVPTLEEAEAFLRKPPGKGKREAAVEALLESPRYAEYWAKEWTALLANRDLLLKGDRPEFKVSVLNGWLQDAFRKNLPYDRIARELVSAQGAAGENGAANYLLRFADAPVEAPGHVSRLFLGTRIQCAQCHDHPFEPRWKQSDYQGFAAFFSAARRQVAGAKQERVVSLKDEDRVPRRGQGKKKPEKGIDPVQPRFLGGEALPDGVPPSERRRKLADWMTAPGNPFFSRAIVNRMWAHFMDRGLCEPVDDLRDSNSPTMPEALSLLADDFERTGYDLKRLIRILVRTRPYLRSSAERRADPEDEKYHAHYRLKPMSVFQLFDSMVRVTGIEGGPVPAEELERRKTRALKQFVFVFDSDEMDEADLFRANLPQVLMRMNGHLAAERTLRFPGGSLDRILKAYPGEDDRIAALFLLTLSRFPSDAERARVKAGWGVAGGAASDYEDLLWALVNSTEFLYVH